MVMQIITYESGTESDSLLNISNNGKDLVSFMLYEVPPYLECVHIICGSDRVTFSQLKPNVNLLSSVLFNIDYLPLSNVYLCPVYVQFIFSETKSYKVKRPIYSEERYWVEDDNPGFKPIILCYYDEIQYIDSKNTPRFEVTWKKGSEQRNETHTLTFREHFKILDDPKAMEQLKQKYKVQEYPEEGRMTIDQDFVISGGLFWRKIRLQNLSYWKANQTGKSNRLVSNRNNIFDFWIRLIIMVFTFWIISFIFTE